MDQANQNSSSGGIRYIITTVIFILIAFVSLYLMYNYTTSSNSNLTTISSGIHTADMPPGTLPIIPMPFEGGEYSFNTWIYISSFNKNRNTRKHIFELKGKYFSTLLVGLGAFSNTLIVRTHTTDMAGVTNVAASLSGSGREISSDTETIGELSVNSVNTLFTPLGADDTLLTTPSVCDLPEIDLQRWTMVTVVLSGRTIDVYIDGKLSRSCISTSYFKVDPMGVVPVMSDRGGFDGHTADTAVANYAMNPDEIYRKYLTGPEGLNQNMASWIMSLFKGSA